MRVPKPIGVLVPLWVALGLVIGSTPPSAMQRTDNAREVRALWVLKASLASPEAIATAVQRAADSGFNTLLVQVRARGDALVADAVEPRAAELEAQPPSFDPLAELLRLARARDLRVHAWVNANLVSSAVELPKARDHLIYRHPEWLMIPRELAGELEMVEAGSPEYLGALARWTRNRSREVEGLYVSPLLPGAVSHLVAVVRELVSRYELDGVQFDYLRYPIQTFDYSRQALGEFRNEVAPDLSPQERQRLEDRAAVDPLVYVDALADRWKTFRMSRLTAQLMRLRTAVKTLRPEAAVSATVVADLTDAREQRFQDWRTWLELGLLDVVTPLAYTQDAAVFAEQIGAARAVAGTHRLWAGIGAFRLNLPQTLEHILTARLQGADGVALFSYDSLASAPERDYLAQIGRSAFARDSVDNLSQTVP